MNEEGREEDESDAGLGFWVSNPNTVVAAPHWDALSLASGQKRMPHSNTMPAVGEEKWRGGKGGFLVTANASSTPPFSSFLLRYRSMSIVQLILSLSVSVSRSQETPQRRLQRRWHAESELEWESAAVFHEAPCGNGGYRPPRRQHGAMTCGPPPHDSVSASSFSSPPHMSFAAERATILQTFFTPSLSHEIACRPKDGMRKELKLLLSTTHAQLQQRSPPEALLFDMLVEKVLKAHGAAAAHAPHRAPENQNKKADLLSSTPSSGGSRATPREEEEEEDVTMTVGEKLLYVILRTSAVVEAREPSRGAASLSWRTAARREERQHGEGRPLSSLASTPRVGSSSCGEDHPPLSQATPLPPPLPLQRRRRRRVRGLPTAVEFEEEEEGKRRCPETETQAGRPPSSTSTAISSLFRSASASTFPSSALTEQTRQILGRCWLSPSILPLVEHSTLLQHALRWSTEVDPILHATLVPYSFPSAHAFPATLQRARTSFLWSFPASGWPSSSFRCGPRRHFDVLPSHSPPEEEEVQGGAGASSRTTLEAMAALWDLPSGMGFPSSRTPIRTGEASSSAPPEDPLPPTPPWGRSPLTAAPHAPPVAPAFRFFDPSPSSMPPLPPFYAGMTAPAPPPPSSTSGGRWADLTPRHSLAAAASALRHVLHRCVVGMQDPFGVTVVDEIAVAREKGEAGRWGPSWRPSPSPPRGAPCIHVVPHPSWCWETEGEAEGEGAPPPLVRLLPLPGDTAPTPSALSSSFSSLQGAASATIFPSCPSLICESLRRRSANTSSATQTAAPPHENNGGEEDEEARERRNDGEERPPHHRPHRSAAGAAVPRRVFASGLLSLVQATCAVGTLLLRLERLCHVAGQPARQAALGSYGQAALAGLRHVLVLLRRQASDPLLAPPPSPPFSLSGAPAMCGTAMVFAASQALRPVQDAIHLLADLFAIHTRPSWEVEESIATRLTSATLLSLLYERVVVRDARPMGSGAWDGRCPPSSSSSSTTVGVAASLDVVGYLFRVVLSPFQRMLTQWLTKGQPGDALDEFFIVPSPSFSHVLFSPSCGGHPLGWSAAGLGGGGGDGEAPLWDVEGGERDNEEEEAAWDGAERKHPKKKKRCMNGRRSVGRGDAEDMNGEEEAEEGIPPYRVESAAERLPVFLTPETAQWMCQAGCSRTTLRAATIAVRAWRRPDIDPDHKREEEEEESHVQRAATTPVASHTAMVPLPPPMVDLFYLEAGDGVSWPAPPLLPGHPVTASLSYWQSYDPQWEDRLVYRTPPPSSNDPLPEVPPAGAGPFDVMGESEEEEKKKVPCDAAEAPLSSSSSSSRFSSPDAFSATLRGSSVGSHITIEMRSTANSREEGVEEEEGAVGGERKEEGGHTLFPADAPQKKRRRKKDPKTPPCWSPPPSVGDSPCAAPAGRRSARSTSTPDTAAAVEDHHRRWLPPPASPFGTTTLEKKAAIIAFLQEKEVKEQASLHRLSTAFLRACEAAGVEEEEEEKCPLAGGTPPAATAESFLRLSSHWEQDIFQTGGGTQWEGRDGEPMWSFAERLQKGKKKQAKRCEGACLTDIFPQLLPPPNAPDAFAAYLRSLGLEGEAPLEPMAVHRCPLYFYHLSRLTSSSLTTRAVQVLLSPYGGPLQVLLQQAIDVFLLQGSGGVVGRVMAWWVSHLPAMSSDHEAHWMGSCGPPPRPTAVHPTEAASSLDAALQRETPSTRLSPHPHRWDGPQTVQALQGVLQEEWDHCLSLASSRRRGAREGERGEGIRGGGKRETQALWLRLRLAPPRKGAASHHNGPPWYHDPLACMDDVAVQWVGHASLSSSALLWWWLPQKEMCRSLSVVLRSLFRSHTMDSVLLQTWQLGKECGDEVMAVHWFCFWVRQVLVCVQEYVWEGLQRASHALRLALSPFVLPSSASGLPWSSSAMDGIGSGSAGAAMSSMETLTDVLRRFFFLCRWSAFETSSCQAALSWWERVLQPVGVVAQAVQEGHAALQRAIERLGWDGRGIDPCGGHGVETDASMPTSESSSSSTRHGVPQERRTAAGGGPWESGSSFSGRGRLWWRRTPRNRPCGVGHDGGLPSSLPLMEKCPPKDDTKGDGGKKRKWSAEKPSALEAGHTLRGEKEGKKADRASSAGYGNPDGLLEFDRLQQKVQHHLREVVLQQRVVFFHALHGFIQALSAMVHTNGAAEEKRREDGLWGPQRKEGCVQSPYARTTRERKVHFQPGAIDALAFDTEEEEEELLPPPSSATPFTGSRCGDLKEEKKNHCRTSRGPSLAAASTLDARHNGPSQDLHHFALVSDAQCYASLEVLIGKLQRLEEKRC